MNLNIELPEKLNFLMFPRRFKTAAGGRGSGKSWSFGSAALTKGIIDPLRILCAREYQNSISASVHALLADRIKSLGYEKEYRILDNEIRGINRDTKIIFKGLSTLTTDSVKSYEGIDIVWIEEAQTISKRSIDILFPTIRKPGSEIWTSYNPHLDTDPIHIRLFKNPPPNSTYAVVNWRDNPWWQPGSALDLERLWCKKFDPDNYDNIWEGKTLPAVEGAIYFKQIQEAEIQGRITMVPYDPMLKVHCFCDSGYSDSMAIGMFQVLGSSYRMIDYIEGSQLRWGDYDKELRKRTYNWGKFVMPHDGHSKRIEADGKSSASIMRALGWDVPERAETVEKGIEEGIKIVRENFHRLYIDKDKCVDFVDKIRKYKRHVSKVTNVVGGPVHDESSHPADMIRYFFINAGTLKNESDNDGWTGAGTRHKTLDGYAGY